MGLMGIEETRRCNVMNLHRVADYFQSPAEEWVALYEELLADAPFLDGLNEQIRIARSDFQYTRGLFAMERLDTVDWCAFQRVLLYALIRRRRPARVVETGVLYGGNTAFMLDALHQNGEGQLVSIDLPAARIRPEDCSRHSSVGDLEDLPPGLRPGFLVPDYLRGRWTFIEGDSLKTLGAVPRPYSLFCHDSEHSHDFVRRELGLARSGLSPDGVLVADDVDWSNGFAEFCVTNRLHPLYLTDNGKAGLRVRTGVVRLDHPWNGRAETTGSQVAGS
ncbi:MAG: class I SAM-dependent methyltransferase [Planctomycetes bacterium]|nr:class I SAM-dependent methyltransferase [Planctomycetota bacterium]